tara:strand:+ start:547 stop:696 length:150 start_codon:yes stop_codon:yes gene_type:complete
MITLRLNLAVGAAAIAVTPIAVIAFFTITLTAARFAGQVTGFPWVLAVR